MHVQICPRCIEQPFLLVRAGGVATADWLEKNLIKYIEKYWQGRASSAESDITDAFIKVRTSLFPSLPCSLTSSVSLSTSFDK